MVLEDQNEVQGHDAFIFRDIASCSLVLKNVVLIKVKIEAMRYSKTSVSVFQIAECYVP